MRIKFWGVRGSSATPERRNSRYGGNTPCVEIRLDNGTLIILDCGSGARALGKSLEREFDGRAIWAYMFFSHFHWDHVQGIPFFAPFYIEGNHFFLHSATQSAADVEGALADQLCDPYMPVDMSVMKSVRNYFDLGETALNLNGAIVTSAPLNHPFGAVAYRIEADGGSFVYATDTEPGSPVHDKAIRDFAKGADVLAYDSQYTPEELRGPKKGWGHSSWSEGVKIARDSGVKKLLLFHHDPEHDDLFVDGLVEAARKEFPQSAGAREGMVINLSADAARTSQTAENERRTEHRYVLQIPAQLEWTNAAGRNVEGMGLLRDVSRSGLYFLAPREASTEQPINVAAILPPEITHGEKITFRYSVQPKRRELLPGSLGSYPSCQGIGGQLISACRNIPETSLLSALPSPGSTFDDFFAISGHSRRRVPSI
jgi:phosphoribosyl 1,2-cyclic phosphodiesterase